jgi:hypothetical protein
MLALVNMMCIQDVVQAMSGFSRHDGGVSGGVLGARGCRSELVGYGQTNPLTGTGKRLDRLGGRNSRRGQEGHWLLQPTRFRR